MDNDPRNNSAKCKPSVTFLTPLDLLPGVAAEAEVNSLSGRVSARVLPGNSSTPSRQCVICGQTFDNTTGLHSHMQSKHKGMKPYRCEYCAKCFAQPETIDMHLQLNHFGQPLMYYCAICPSKPRYKGDAELVQHMRQMHKKPFKCVTCMKCCDTEHALNKHAQQHIVEQSYKCGPPKSELPQPDCGDSMDVLKTQATQSSSGVLPFDCPLCEQSFALTNELDAHIYVHDNETPFECPDCAALFDTLALFWHHMLSHNSIVKVDVKATVEEDAHSDYNDNDVAGCTEDDNQNDECFASEPTTIVKIENDLAKLGVTISYNCPLCDEQFNELADFNGHTKMHNTPTADQPPETNVTEMVDRTPSAGANVKKPRAPVSVRWQEKDNKIRNFKCTECSRSFTLASTLQLHSRRTHLGIKPYECTVCGWKFAQSSDLTKHMRKHTGERPYQCSYCAHGFAQKRNLQNHMKMHVRPPSVCRYCDKQFLLDTSLTQHLKRHEGDNAEKCPQCAVQFADTQTLAKHMNRVHSAAKTYRCEQCDKTFSKSSDLRKHARKHSGERPYTCNVCEKTFAHQTSLRNHRAVHTGDRPFQCSYCGQGFSFNGNLKVHIRSHTGERPYTCTVCNKSFARSANLSEHIKIHTGEKSYKCDICAKSFTNSSTFSKHRKIHTGEKPHKCKFCEKAFIQLAHLTKHLRIHTGEKPYTCTVCTKHFRRSDTLANHLKIHRKEMVTAETGGPNVAASNSVEPLLPAVSECQQNVQPIIVSAIEAKNSSTIPVAIIYTNQQQMVQQQTMMCGGGGGDNVPQLMYTITTPAKVVNGNFELSTTNPALNPHFVITQL